MPQKKSNDREYKEKFKETGENIKDIGRMVDSDIRKHPLESIGVAFVVGALSGLLIASLIKNKQ